MRRRHPTTIPAAPARAMLLGLFVLALAPIAAAQTPQPSAPQPPPAAQQPQPAAAKPAPAPAAQAAATAPRPGTAIRSPGRRRSYASCNRQSQARGLRGGVRRRFLIRCRLGYERPRPAQPAPSQNPPARQP